MAEFQAGVRKATIAGDDALVQQLQDGIVPPPLTRYQSLTLAIYLFFCCAQHCMDTKGVSMLCALMGVGRSKEAHRADAP